MNVLHVAASGVNSVARSNSWTGSSAAGNPSAVVSSSNPMPATSFSNSSAAGQGLGIASAGSWTNPALEIVTPHVVKVAKVRLHVFVEDL